MAKSRSVYECQACGARTPRWYGQCGSCAEWNTLQEIVEERAPRAASRRTAPLRALALDAIDVDRLPRLQAGMAEWDQVLGGGIVPGSVVLLGGDPGVGKSTLLLHVAAAIAAAAPSTLATTPQTSVLYVTGEESLAQVASRGRRLHLDAEGLRFASETDLDVILRGAEAEAPRLLVVDSIQSISDPQMASSPGSVAQARECTLRLTRLAKERDVAVLLIGHVTKEGVIAGPKVLEHMVDAVLYLEGERFNAFRVLRSVKNRFGATNEVGVFEMRDAGLYQVTNPSAAFLADRAVGASGSCVVATLEGTRPLLVEVQSLVTRSSLAVPRRVSGGIDFNRLMLLTAVISKRLGVPLHEYDVHLNVVGGLRLEETSADLGAALAVLSSFRDVPLDSTLVAIGEVGLAGELRSVGQMDARLREAAKLGFTRAVVPRHAEVKRVAGIDVQQAATLREAAQLAGVQSGQRI